MLLLSILLAHGDIAGNLLAEARRSVGLNQTQAQICLALAGFEQAQGKAPRGLTPAQLSNVLASPGTRVHNQLAILLKEGLVKKARLKAQQTEGVDLRKQHYALTSEGGKIAEEYWRLARKADRLFRQLVSVKDEEVIRRIHDRLDVARNGPALGSSITLRGNLYSGQLKRYRRT